MKKTAILASVLTSVFLTAQAAEINLVKKTDPNHRKLATRLLMGESLPAKTYLEGMTCVVTQSTQGNVPDGTEFTVYKGTKSVKLLQEAQDQNDILQAINVEVITVNGKMTMANLTVDAMGYLSLSTTNKSLKISIEWNKGKVEYSLSDFEGRMSGKGFVSCN
jgi:hypothetical protein